MYKLHSADMNKVLARLQEQYAVYAPRRNKGVVRYGEIASVEEIELSEQSAFSPKEIYFPIVQTMLYFSGGTCRQSAYEQKQAIILARPCDINGIKRLDKIFMENGGIPDMYYERRRNQVKLWMLECTEGFDGCFCVAVHGNAPVEYDAALRIRGDEVHIKVVDDKLAHFFHGYAQYGFEPVYPKENVKKVELPDIREDNYEKVFSLPMWQDAARECVGCGGCNAVCGTCSCFDTIDVIYGQTSLDGERRRVWGGCMREDFSAMAGGHNVRPTAGDRLRFKVMHKLYDYKKRFQQEHMCVGCGRCDAKCPADISFAGTIYRLSRELGGRHE